MFRIIRDALSDQLFRRNDELLGTVVDRTIDELSTLLGEHAAGMNVAETRGYVRARARRIVQKHVAVLANELGGLTPRTRTAIGAKAVEQVAHKLARQLSIRPLPIGRRMAA